MAGRLVLIALLPLYAFCESPRLAWEQLHQWSGPDSRARIRTVDGAGIEARIESVQPDRLVLAILKSSDRKRYAPGEMVLDRASVRQLEVRREKPISTAGRTSFAVLLGGLGALAATGADGDSPAAAKALAGGVFWSVIGYAIGKKADMPPWNQVELAPAARTAPSSGNPPE